MQRVDELIKSGHVFVVDADLKGFCYAAEAVCHLRFVCDSERYLDRSALGGFDTIPHDQLMERVKEKISDGPVLKLIQTKNFLKADIMFGTERWTPEKGAPQGVVLSPDQRVRRCPSSLYLKLVDSRTDEFSFLGYTFRGTNHWSRDKSRQKLRDTLRQITKRTSGQCLPSIIKKANQSLRGWFEYFKHSTFANVFEDEDGWLRRRLRSLLRKRSKRRGISKGIADNKRWPNAFFAKQGLFSLKAAHAAVLQSSPR